MSIETLEEDLKSLTTRCPDGPLVTVPDLVAFIKNDLVPYISAVVEEVVEHDAGIDSLFHNADDVLHEENASVFAAVITLGKQIGNELRVRVGTDKRLLAVLKEWNALLETASTLLTEIVVPDQDDEDEDEVETPAESESEPGPATEKADAE